jgi:hypothetical protein
LSFSSGKSTGTDLSDIDEIDETTVGTKKKKCCRKPFIFKILKLNLPEINWIILGCITSILFGCVTPVSEYLKINQLK